METERKLIVYVDWVSQPCRAVISFCRLNNIPHDVKEVRVFKFQHMDDEFTKINPAQKVPAIQEVDTKTGKVLLNLGESHAILRYLAATRRSLVPEHWYPSKDLEQQAYINEYLDRHHTWLRQGSGGLVFKKCFSPIILKKEVSKNVLSFHETMLARSLRMMENTLKKTKYLCGDEITIADLSAAHELDMTRFINLDLSKWPHVKAWLHHMIDENPINLEVCAVVRKRAEEF